MSQKVHIPPHLQNADFHAAFAAVKVLHSHGYEGLFIGGSVRDLLLHRTPKDFDIVTNATPEQIHDIPEFSKTFYKDPAQAYGVSRVHLPDWPNSEVEIATFRRDLNPHKGRKETSVEFADSIADAQRRDFTINALTLNPETSELFDHVGGLDDLTRKKIRFIGSAIDRTAEDPLRILRAIRFKNSLGFDYAKDTLEALKTAVAQGYIEKIATDRLRLELNLMLTHHSRRSAVLDLDEIGILERILPEITRGKGVVQPPEIHAEGDVWTHTLLAIDALPHAPSVRLAWATFLHDIGKPPTQTPPSTPDDRVRFNRHYAVGAEMADGLLRRFNFSNKMIKDICWMIAHHINIDDIPHMRSGHQRTLLEHPAFEDLLELHKADAQATWPPSGPHTTPPTFPEIEAAYKHFLAHTATNPKPSLKRDLGIHGHWLLQKFPETAEPNNRELIGIILKDLTHAYEIEGVSDISLLTERAARIVHQHISSH